MFFLCPICKVENRQNARFCRRCGRARVELERLAGPPALHEHASVKEVEVPTAAVVASFEEEIFEDEGIQPLGGALPQCSACWAKLRLTDKYCYGCGEPQPERSLSHLKACAHCQAHLPLGANFCFSCGTEVNSAQRRNVRSPVELFKDENSEFFPRFEA